MWCIVPSNHNTTLFHLENEVMFGLYVQQILHETVRLPVLLVVKHRKTTKSNCKKNTFALQQLSMQVYAGIIFGNILATALLISSMYSNTFIRMKSLWNSHVINHLWRYMLLIVNTPFSIVPFLFIFFYRDGWPSAIYKGFRIYQLIITSSYCKQRHSFSFIHHRSILFLVWCGHGSIYTLQLIDTVV
jgi:hypothetical protein